MFRRFLQSSIPLVLASALFAGANAQDRPFSRSESPLPEPTSPVMDYAGVIDAATKQRLEDRLLEFRKTSSPSVEIGVAVVKTTGGRPIFDYSLAVARGWGIGSRNDDNPGALLFVAVDDRKYFTQISRDLEDELPDGLVGSIQRQYLVPEFRKGNYGKGIEDTIEAFIRVIESRQKGEPQRDANDGEATESDDSNGITGSIAGRVFRTLLCWGAILLIILIAAGASRGGGKGGGGGSGGGFLPLLIAAFLSGGGSSGSSSGWSSGGWGGSSGGFGGFGGGGSFGGGGAGGSW